MAPVRGKGHSVAVLPEDPLLAQFHRVQSTLRFPPSTAKATVYRLRRRIHLTPPRLRPASSAAALRERTLICRLAAAMRDSPAASRPGP